MKAKGRSFVVTLLRMTFLESSDLSRRSLPGGGYIYDSAIEILHKMPQTFN